MSNIFDIFKKISSGNEQTSNEPYSFIVAGLGNPGKQYLESRHNTGFSCIDMLMQKEGFELNKSKFSALCGEKVISGRRVLIMKPQTFMNKSGEAVRSAADFYKIPFENILVISDDVSLDIGTLRIKRKGSDGGQKGLRDIIYQLSSDNFPRIKIGVGKKPTPEYDLAAWVLGDIPKGDRDCYCECLRNACEAITMIIDGKIEEAMNRFN